MAYIQKLRKTTFLRNELADLEKTNNFGSFGSTTTKLGRLARSVNCDKSLFIEHTLNSSKLQVSSKN